MIFRNDLGFIYAFQDLFLINRNPNIYDILSNINTLSTIYFTTSYNRITFKFTFTRIYTQTTDYYDMYIKPYNSGNFLGLSNDVEFLVSFIGSECTYPINIITIKSLCIGISGNISFR